MSGRPLMIAALIGLGVFAAALWYFQTYAFYRDLPQQPFVIQGTEYPVETWKGTDADSSPLKMRVCLTVSPVTAERILAEHAVADDGEPLVAPSWFDCFDAKQISRDVLEGKAWVYAPGTSPFADVHDYLALYPDGRGFLWRQLDPKFDTQ